MMTENASSNTNANFNDSAVLSRITDAAGKCDVILGIAVGFCQKQQLLVPALLQDAGSAEGDEGSEGDASNKILD